MTIMTPLKYHRDLAECLDMKPQEALQHYKRFQAFCRKRKITVGYNQRRRTFFAGYFPPGKACEYRTVRFGLGAFVDFMDAPSETLKKIQAPQS